VNLYGPEDHFSLEDSHVIPAMIRKFHEAKESGDSEVVMWGSGNPSREFLYVDDAARALLLAGEKLTTSDPVNIGSGVETSIRELAETIARLTGYEGAITWDTSKPDGQPKRCLDVTRARELMGFDAEIEFEDGLRKTIQWYRSAAEGQIEESVIRSSA